MNLTGNMLIGSTAVAGSEATLYAVNPTTMARLDPPFTGGGAAEVEQACTLADAAFDCYRETSGQTRASLLEAIADGILALGHELIERTMAETGLPRARLEGERGRTVGQLRLFAALAREGRYLEATIDTPLPERSPVPRPDLRLRRIPLGPVAVFGASNFPLAFSVAGGDTASALAAGCPVVVKAHNGHLGTSELVGRVIQQAVADAGLPAGVFALLVGAGNEIGAALASHKAIRAIGFTGSRQGGLALCNIANRRPEPIPVYAEMSSINPMFLLPGALGARAEQLARGFIDSLVLGAGQFCTNPGVVIALRGTDLDRFIDAASTALATSPAATMLTEGIHAAYEGGVARLASHPAVRSLAQAQDATAGWNARASLFCTEAAQFLRDKALSEEVFGPASLIVECADIEEMVEVARALDGQLTATLHLSEADFDSASRLTMILENKAGRLLVNGFPTGVEVAHAMVHGGPFPATSDSRTTSVGARSIDRFLRPVCYQNFPEALLPEALHDANPLGLWRLIDGKLSEPL